MERRRFCEAIGSLGTGHEVRAKPQNPKPKPRGNSKSEATKHQNRRERLLYDLVPDGAPIVNEVGNGNGLTKHPFDLEERTTLFGEAIVRFCKKVPRDPTNDRLVGQLAGCGTSVGANYCEADERVSKKDFRNIIGRCVKEAKETKYFLRMIAAAEPRLSDEARKLFRGSA